jgi:hypothetical protein
MSEAWHIIRLTLIHCGIAVTVCAIFTVALYTLGLMYSPDSLVVWWFSNIDLMLAIIASTVLAIMFLNGLLRIGLDAVISAWKGFLHVNTHIILA